MASDRSESFEKAYRWQLEELGAWTILADLKHLSGGRPLVVLCWERLDDPGDWCHRTMLAHFLEEHASIEVSELEPGMIPPRPYTPEPRLF